MAIPFVSVIVPAWRAAHTIHRAVDSLLAQTRPPDEILVIDDGSPDDIAVSLNPYGERVTLIRQANGGAASARNHGLERARGDLLAFLDADDTWEPHKLARQLDVLERHPEVGVVAARYYQKLPGEPRALRNWPAAPFFDRVVTAAQVDVLAVAKRIWTSTVVVRRAALAGRRFDTTLKTAEDIDLWIRLLLAGQVYLLSEPLATMILEPGSLSRSDVADDYRNMLTVVHRYAAALGPARTRLWEARIYREWAAGHLGAGEPRAALRPAWKRAVRQPWSLEGLWILVKSACLSCSRRLGGAIVTSEAETLVGTHRRRNVAHLTQSLDMGGAEKLLVEFAKHTDRRRFAPRVVSLTTRGVLADEIEATGCPMTALEVGNGFRPSLFLRLAQLFRRWQIDVVHTHDDRPHIYGTGAALLARVPRVIHTRHGQRLNLSARQRRLVNWLARFTDRFVCVSRDSARLAVERGVQASKVCTIWNGIDTTRFTNCGPRGMGPAVIVARLVPEKDMETLLRAVDLARREDASFRLEIAGDGVCMAQLRSLAAELNLGDSVTFLGQTRDVAAVLARAQLFVLSSISEGVSLTLLEAMATGLAVVATNVGGNPEVVADGETGLLVPPRDPAALATALLRLRRNSDERTRMGQAGRERVEQYFDVRRMVEQYEDLYRGDRTATVRERRIVPMGRTEKSCTR